MSLAPSLEDLSDRHHSVVLHMHGVIAEHIMFWRRLIVDVTVFNTTAMMALTGFAISRDSLDTPALVVFCVMIVTLGVAGVTVCKLMSKHMYDSARIIVKFDRIHGLFETGAYLPDETIYPADWTTYGTASWREPVISFCLWLQALTSVFLSAVTVLTGL
jgi:hypothetical protein